jgi:PhnB protein
MALSIWEGVVCRLGTQEATMSITRLNPYVNFNGNCFQAIALYEKALGAKVENLMRYGDLPGNTPSPENKDRVLHCQLQIGSQAFMVSDVPAERPVKSGGSAHIAVDIDDAVEGAAAFKALSLGGQITVPLGPAFWGGQFGMVTDAFGVQWMVNCPA